MFSISQKRLIANNIHIKGAESWSWADIRNNGDVQNPSINPWNEK